MIDNGKRHTAKSTQTKGWKSLGSKKISSLLSSHLFVFECICRGFYAAYSCSGKANLSWERFHKNMGWVGAYIFGTENNHRFTKDPVWGKTLRGFRKDGPTEQDIQRINSRQIVVIKHCSIAKGPKEIDGILLHILGQPIPPIPPFPSRASTICIKADKIQWWKSISHRKKEYKDFNQFSKDILYACVCEAHVKSSGNSKPHDALLKLYFGT